MRMPRRTDRRCLDVACQVVHLERGADHAVIDLVTLETAWLGEAQVPCGAPLAIRFGTQDAEACVALLRLWERDGVIVDLSCRQTRRGLRATLALGPRRLTLRSTGPASLIGTPGRVG